MTTIKIYGKKGMIICKPFKINTADDEPEAMTEEKQIINSPASESDKQEESKVAEQTGN